MTRKSVDTLIVDLDNTLFDWFAVWYASFEPVYREIIRVTGLPVDKVEADIRLVHQARRTSEYSFLIDEIGALKDLREEQDIRKCFQHALDAARHGRDQVLQLYPSVFRCLWDVKRKGTKIVAYTESMAFYSAYRLKRFGLDGVIDVLFSPEDHDVPSGVSIDKLRRFPDEFYELQVTETRHTPPGALKPNPRVLLDILQAIGAKADHCAYVGDSLFKDVAMAREVGVFDIHAKYGESQRRPEYSLLQRVSHWTEADVQREREIIENGNTFEPSAVLKDTFAETFIYCDFETFNVDRKSKDEEQAIKNGIEIWKKTVDVQQHFNDLEMCIRNFAITIVGALIAALGFTYQQGLETTAFGHRFAAGLGLVVAAAFAWLSFFLMDRYWYHIFLRGAVTHAGKIEDQLKASVPNIDLGHTISEVSGSVKILGIAMNSERRLTNFYMLGFIMLAIVFISLVLAVPNRLPTAPVSSATTMQPAQAPALQQPLPASK